MIKRTRNPALWLMSSFVRSSLQDSFFPMHDHPSLYGIEIMIGLQGRCFYIQSYDTNP